jgi:hypothetical protein
VRHVYMLQLKAFLSTAIVANVSWRGGLSTHLVLAQEHLCKAAHCQASAHQHLARIKLPLTPEQGHNSSESPASTIAGADSVLAAASALANMWPGTRLHQQNAAKLS